MKILKFRAWEIDEKRWLDKDELFFSILRNKIHGWQKEGSWEISQFTGLKDVDEKDIYEGDILSSKEFYKNDSENIYKNIGVVRYCDGFGDGDIGYYIEGKEFKNGKEWRPFIKDLKKARWGIDGNCNKKPISNGGWIIGNIYENPELLKDEHKTN